MKKPNIVKTIENNDDDERLMSTSGVLSKLIEYSSEEVPEEDTSRARCRFSLDARMVCNKISKLEHIEYTKVFTSIVLIGYGIRYNEFKKNGFDNLSVIEEFNIKASDSDNAMLELLSADPDKIIYYEGEWHNFRMKKRFIAETNELANNIAVMTPDLYLHYFWAGIDKLTKEEPFYSRFKTNSFFMSGLHQFNIVKKRIEDKVIFIGSIQL